MKSEAAAIACALNGATAYQQIISTGCYFSLMTFITAVESVLNDGGKNVKMAMSESVFQDMISRAPSEFSKSPRGFKYGYSQKESECIDEDGATYKSIVMTSTLHKMLIPIVIRSGDDSKVVVFSDNAQCCVISVTK